MTAEEKLDKIDKYMWKIWKNHQKRPGFETDIANKVLRIINPDWKY